MDYYKTKKEFMGAIKELLISEKGKVLKLSSLERELGLKYGFGRLAILRVLLLYEKNGQIIFYRYKDGKEPNPNYTFDYPKLDLEEFEVLE